MWNKNREECKKKHLSGVRDIADKTERCRKLIAARKCDADFVAEICTEIHRWAIDRDWQAVTEVYYSDCTDSMSQGLSNLTKAEASWTKERKKQPEKTYDGPMCDTIAICSQQLKTTARFYQHLSEFPISEAAWNTSWKSMCNMRWGKFLCIERAGCTNSAIKVEAQLNKKRTEFMCSPDGEKYFLRVYRDGPLTCLGNSNTRMMWEKNHQECKKKHLSGIRDIAVKTERCRKLIAARKCDADFVAKICTEIHRWAIDRDWQAVTEVYYSDCTDSMSEALYNLTDTQLFVAKERKKMPGPDDIAIHLTYEQFTINID
ncbi:hypothetical protein RRG08_014323 [Elysia crispata]|uniref:Uncharacterized protein n=1 Tax=Elysia crispata TaxID=231223 RepID=A0AAE0Z053_9GAST|nr:hypothetical protein RRG08_014323 [Elysia crispata]